MVFENAPSLTVDTTRTTTRRRTTASSLPMLHASDTDSCPEREETSVSEDPSSAFLLHSFVTPAQSPLFDSTEESSMFQDATSSPLHEEPQNLSPITSREESNNNIHVPLMDVATRQVSLISASASFDDEEEPTSPAFSVVTNTGVHQPVSPECSSTHSNSSKSLDTFDSQVKKTLDALDHNKDDQESSTTAPSTDVENNNNTNEEEEDLVVEQVEVIQWLPHVSAAVEHSFRSPTRKMAWNCSQVTPVDRIPYIHGSYASAAPLFVYNKKWMRILRRLMPAGHADAMEILREAEEAFATKRNNDKQMARLMKWAENNPVVAAFGVLNSNTGTESSSLSRSSSTDSSSYKSRRSSRERTNRRRSSQEQQQAAPVLEWDVFLDPTLVKKVEKAMFVAEQVRNDADADYQEEIAADIEVDRQVGRLINRMMLAHGSASHLVSEALGVASQYNFTKLVEQGEAQRMYRRKEYEKKWKSSGLHFSRNGMDLGGKTWLVREQAQAAFMNFERHRQPRIEGKASAKPAGIFVERWLALFLRALHIAKASPSALAFDDFYIEQDELTPQVAAESIKTKPPMCGMFLCLGIEDPNASKVDHSKTSMAATAGLIEDALGSPLRVILDLKSRRVPARVWARVIDNMRNRGIVVDGLGSFDIEELRSIVKWCASDVTEVRFFHSAGDLQKACHAKEVNIGDTVYFNAGSLLWERPSKISNVVCGKPDLSQAVIEDDVAEVDGVRFQPFAFPNRHNRKNSNLILPDCEATLQDYKDRFQLNIGCYVQEFSISDRNLDAITRFLNKHKSLYNLGLAWGGINGKCHEGLSGDGYWNQRYMGRKWDNTAKPTEDMQLLAPEDHPLVQRAVRAGAWGGIGTVNNIGEEHTPETQALQIGACAITNTGNTTCG